MKLLSEVYAESYRYIQQNSPSWARTNNPSVNSRMLYHWAIEEYHESIFCLLKHHVPSKPHTESYYIHPIIASPFWTFLTLPCFWMNHTMDISKNASLFRQYFWSILRVWISLRPISSSQLHALLHFHLCPIYLVFFKGSWDISSWGGLHA